MLEISPPEFQGSLREQIIQAEIWLRHFKEEVDNMFVNLATTVMRLKTTQMDNGVEKKITGIEQKIIMLIDVLWTIQVGYDQDNEIYQGTNGWFMQRSTEPADVGNIESILITCGSASVDPLELIESAPKHYTGDPIVIQTGNSFVVIGEQYDGEETENQLPEEEQSAET